MAEIHKLPVSSGMRDEAPTPSDATPPPKPEPTPVPTPEPVDDGTIGHALIQSALWAEIAEERLKTRRGELRTLMIEDGGTRYAAAAWIRTVQVTLERIRKAAGGK